MIRSVSISSPIFQTPAEVISNREIGPELYWIDLHAPDVARHAHPGHFVHLIVSDCSGNTRYPAWMRHTPLLRRPFSIAECDTATGIFGLIYRVVGGGTQELAMRRPGQRVDVLGPLGRPFEPIRSDRPAVMIAGGVGVAPFFFLTARALQSGQAGPEDMLMLFGAATAALLSGQEKFRDMGVPVRPATNDGSLGHRGFVTELLEQTLREEQRYMYVCGPTPMMRRSQTLARQYGMDGQVSLEGIMPCGVGVCMACVIPCRNPERPESTSRYERVCDTGPVFDIREVIFE
jgi:dihydroorotate dehydrogenase electron transfer subunit